MVNEPVPFYWSNSLSDTDDAIQKLQEYIYFVTLTGWGGENSENEILNSNWNADEVLKFDFV